jgi:hypothetical protein
MATWKKVAVSGSNVSQFNNDSGYLTAATVPVKNAFSTASYDGTNILADNGASALNFASGSGTGLNISANASTDTLTFSLNAVPNASLQNSAVTVTAGNGLTDGGSVSLGGSTTLNIGAGTHITVNADDVAVNTGTLIPAVWAASASYTGSIFSGITGDVTITAGGVSAIGSGVIVDGDVNASAAIAYTKINFGASGFVSGSSLSSPGQGEVVLTTNGVAGSTIDLGLQTSDSPQFVGLTLTGDAAVNGGDITTSATTFNLVNSNATTVNFAGAATTLNVGNASGTTTIAGNAIVQGDFTVNGTTTYINTQDLYVEDKFIVLASGSATAGDGGIMIDRGSDSDGNIAYGYDSVTDRWGFQNGMADTSNILDPTSGAGVNGAFAAYVFTEAGHGSTKPVTGEFAVQGAMYTSNAGDIWIYA